MFVKKKDRILSLFWTILSNALAGGGGAPVAVSAAPASGAAAPAAAAPAAEEKKVRTLCLIRFNHLYLMGEKCSTFNFDRFPSLSPQEEPKEESDEDMGFSLFD